MGNCHQREQDSSFSIVSQLNFQTPIGRGSFGIVWRAVYKPTNLTMAVKVFVKSQIPSKEALLCILKERQILTYLNHPFLINMHFAFHDIKKLYLGLDYKPGGDLRYHMLRKSFTESQTKFIIACILEGLSYIHSKNIIHKDLKPENVIFNEQGYAFLTDFGTASVYNHSNSNETSGTPGYMAPEVICRQQHSFVSDYFALGVILYEIIMGTRPYLGRNRKEIREKIMESQAKITENNVAPGWSLQAADLCNKLLKRKPNGRIGANGVEEVKGHCWFDDVNFMGISNFEVKPEFCPAGNENYDYDHVNFYGRRILARKDNFNRDEFSGYFYLPEINTSA